MALLPEEKRKEILEYLGYEYNAEGIKKFQGDYMARKSDADGKWGPNTQNAALTVYNVKRETKNFTAKEFRCECNGKYCCGFPDYMKVNELRHIQTIRDHYGKPMKITCGLRCPTENKNVGGIKNSKHLTGQAVDFYIPGVSDTLENRKKSIKYIKTLPHHTFTYGHGIDSTGSYYNAPGMGNALHTDTDNESDSKVKPTPAPAPEKGLTVDGIGGPATVTAAQNVFGTPADGVVTGQLEKCKKFFPALKSVRFGGGGSALVMSIQRWAGARADGVWGEDTSKAVQRKLGVKDDGIFGPDSMKAFQRFLNAHEGETIRPYAGQILDVSDFQSAIDWNKVKAEGIVGAIIKCGYRGGQIGTLKEDAMFMKHIKGAHAAGLKVGIYMFTEGINAAEGKAEAAFALNMMQKAGIPLSYPIAVDTESMTYYDEKKKKRMPGRANGLSKAKRTEVIDAFCKEIKAHGYEPMIYASTSWLNNQLDMSKLPYKVWCAQYFSKCEYKGEYILWQYTSDGHVSGVKGDVDVNKVR